MKRTKKSKANKSRVNICLSPDVIEKGRLLVEPMNRPSFSSVVEELIKEKATQLKPAA